MTSRLTAAIQARRIRGCNDRGFTLTELMVAMLLTAVLLAVIIAPLISVTNTANKTQTASQAAETTTLAIESMQAGVSSAALMCLPTQVTPSASSNQVVQPGNAVRVLTDVFDPAGNSYKWEQWWLDPASGQLRTQTWPFVGGTPPSTWSMVTGNMAPTTGHLPFAITSEGISTVGSLPAGVYPSGGAIADGTTGEHGSWTYTLNVYTPTAGTIAQTEPTSGTVTAAGSAAFSDQLTPAGNNGTVTYTQTTGIPTATTAGLMASPGGKVTPAILVTTPSPHFVPTTLTAGPYTAGGTTADGNGNTGTWAYSLHVYTPTAGTIVQIAPTSGTVSTTAPTPPATVWMTGSGPAAFSDQLAVTGNSTPATFTQTTGLASLAVSTPPSPTRPKLLTITLTALTGVKATAVSTPVTSSLAALNTPNPGKPDTCLTVVH